MKITSDILKSYLVLALIWVFIGAYFTDAANLDDLLPNTIVFHPEADDSSPDGTPLSFTGDGVIAQKAQSAPNQGDQSRKTKTLRIVIDQDSPSLAPEPLVSMVSSKSIPENPIHITDPFTSSSSLYLLNCMLLI
jgi:hypothetical protein